MRLWIVTLALLVSMFGLGVLAGLVHDLWCPFHGSRRRGGRSGSR